MERNSLISLKTVASNVPTVVSLGDTITNPYDIANSFNNYFVSIAETTKKYSHNYFLDYLSNKSDSTIFLQPIDKEEIANIYPFLILIRFLAQIVYLIEYYFI